MSDTTRRYLVSQRAVMPASCCYLITTALSPLFNYLFIFRQGFLRHLVLMAVLLLGCVRLFDDSGAFGVGCVCGVYTRCLAQLW